MSDGLPAGGVGEGLRVLEVVVGLGGLGEGVGWGVGEGTGVGTGV